MYSYGEEINFDIVLLSPDNKKLLGDFSCGNDVIDEYIRNRAIDDEYSVSYLCVDNSNNRVIGFTSLRCSGIYCTIENMSNTLPAIEISYFAIDINVQDLVYDSTDEHFYFSDYLFIEIIKKCRDISERYIGAQYIILYSVPDAKHFYERNFFKDYTEFMNKNNHRFLDGCIPMYMDL